MHTIPLGAALGLILEMIQLPHAGDADTLELLLGAVVVVVATIGFVPLLEESLIPEVVVFIDVALVEIGLEEMSFLGTPSGSQLNDPTKS